MNPINGIFCSSIRIDSPNVGYWQMGHGSDQIIPTWFELIWFRIIYYHSLFQEGRTLINNLRLNVIIQTLCLEIAVWSNQSILILASVAQLGTSQSQTLRFSSSIRYDINVTYGRDTEGTINSLNNSLLRILKCVQYLK